MIILKELQGKIYYYKNTNNDTILDIKKNISKRLNKNINTICLLHNNNNLENNKVIKNNIILNLIFNYYTQAKIVNNIII